MRDAGLLDWRRRAFRVRSAKQMHPGLRGGWVPPCQSACGLASARENGAVTTGCRTTRSSGSGLAMLAPPAERERSAKSRGDVVLVSCPAAWVMTEAFSCPGSNHCNRAVLGRDIASRTQCREETRHVLQYIDLANPQSSRRFR